jgi:hypothetical protein
MKTTTSNQPNQTAKLDYQAPVISELQVNEFTQSASQIMSESSEGYYS